jgi:hypothetical protein
MRSYVLRHGGQIPKRIISERDPTKIHRMMRDIDMSDKEDWKLSGIGGAGFWSRWYLWSQPTFEDVRKFMTRKFGIKFI